MNMIKTLLKKPVAHNLQHAFCRLIDRLYFLVNKRPFNIIL